MNSNFVLLEQRRNQSLKTIFRNPKDPFFNPTLKPYKTPQTPYRVLNQKPFSTHSSKFPEYEMPTVTWGVVQGSVVKGTRLSPLAIRHSTFVIASASPQSRTLRVCLLFANTDFATAARRAPRGEAGPCHLSPFKTLLLVSPSMATRSPKL
ncbi:hypothetical protein H5410_055512 [Solanum commersonii]|uniref:Uncharacterized protein n=1 Tax=Solanum commersonii TaxID=4109 RepID=A0A9J5WIH9_SOLCO|nr:hypothetical protein H5410_055512 [Solanum commersonii]